MLYFLFSGSFFAATIIVLYLSSFNKYDILLYRETIMIKPQLLFIKLKLTFQTAFYFESKLIFVNGEGILQSYDIVTQKVEKVRLSDRHQIQIIIDGTLLALLLYIQSLFLSLSLLSLPLPFSLSFSFFTSLFISFKF